MRIDIRSDEIGNTAQLAIPLDARNRKSTVQLRAGERRAVANGVIIGIDQVAIARFVVSCFHQTISVICTKAARRQVEGSRIVEGLTPMITISKFHFENINVIGAVVVATATAIAFAADTRPLASSVSTQYQSFALSQLASAS